MADSGFAERLAYVRWLRDRGRLKPETDGELATATGVTAGWIAKWKGREDSPNDRRMSGQFVSGLGVDGGWLLDGAGTPPEPELWQAWSSVARRIEAASRTGGTREEIDAAATAPGDLHAVARQPPRKRQAAKGKARRRRRPGRSGES